MGRNPHHPPVTFKALPYNLGSWFLVNNFLLTQLEDILIQMWGHLTPHSTNQPKSIGFDTNVNLPSVTQIDR
jgi:hypothetical protein